MDRWSTFEESVNLVNARLQFFPAHLLKAPLLAFVAQFKCQPINK